jgi:hypothetical protein
MARLLRCQLLKPPLEIRMQPGFIVVDKDRRGDVHGIHQAKSFADATFGQTLLDLGRYVGHGTPPWQFVPEFFSVHLHK